MPNIGIQTSKNSPKKVKNLTVLVSKFIFTIHVNSALQICKEIAIKIQIIFYERNFYVAHIMKFN